MEPTTSLRTVSIVTQVNHFEMVLDISRPRNWFA